MNIFPHDRLREKCRLAIPEAKIIASRISRIERIIPESKIDRILDIGCGQGYLIKAGLEIGLNIYGTDIEDIFEGDMSRFRKGDATKEIPFKSESFDLVHERLFLDDLLSLQEVPDKKIENAVREIYRILSPGGYFFRQLSDYGIKSPLPGFTLVKKYHSEEAIYKKNNSFIGELKTRR